jgi:hypothetical protein
MSFFESHAHPMANYMKQTKDKSEKSTTKDLLSKDELLLLGTTLKQKSISSIFGLTPASSQGFLNVGQQLQIWENSMKGFTEHSSFMLEFNWQAFQASKSKKVGKDMKLHQIV